MQLRLIIVFILAGCGAGSGGPNEQTTAARAETGLTATDRGRPAPQRVARAIGSVPRAELPARRLCDDPSVQGGDLIIGGERVRLRSTCPTDWPFSPGLPERR